MADPPLVLRDYQRAAIAALDSSPRRAVIQAGCGCGKTLLGPHAAAKLLAGKPATVLVLFPTLSLLEQTYRVWRSQAPFEFSALAFCSESIDEPEDITADELSVSSTTSPQRLAEWMCDTAGTRVVFATYQSSPLIAAAHAEHGLPAWALAIADEAHRTAGIHGKAFSAILYEEQIPARHRLFFTATPKVHNGGRDHRVASMDDRRLYGRTVFSLPTREAITRGILSDFRVAVIAVASSEVNAALRDLSLVSLTDERGDAGGRVDHVASAIALTRAAADYQLSSVLAFHNTIRASTEFADTFRRTHAVLAAKGLVPDGRSAGIVHIDGTSKLRDRLDAVATLDNPDPAGQHWNIVTNARCLSEGVNVPALDAIFFAQARSSEIDVAQAVGRAIRKSPHHDRPALVILALLVDDSDDADSVIDLSDFQRVRQVLRALHDHDPTISRDLARARAILDDPQPDEDGVIDAGLIEVRIPTALPPRLAKEFLTAFSVQTLDTLAQRWEDNFAALAAFVDTYGHANVAQQYRSPTGQRLGLWVSDQRRAHAQGRLLPYRRKRLEELPGWAWNNLDAAWEANFAALADFARRHGHAYPPRDYHHDGAANLNQWVIGHRRPGRRDALAATRRARLESLPGWSWEPRQQARWEDGFAALTGYVDAHGNADPPAEFVTASGFALGEWVAQMRQPSRQKKLAADRRRRLDAVPGWSWEAPPRPRRDDSWEMHLRALVEYAELHHHASPPQRYRTDSGLGLGRWVSDQRKAQAQGTLPAARAQRLQTLPGWSWNVVDARWEQNFAALADYAGRHGDTDPPPGLLSPTGIPLAGWVRGTRRADRRGELSADRSARLAQLPGWSSLLRRTDLGWETALGLLQQWSAAHGHASPPQDARTDDGFALGQWVGRQRRAYRTGRLPAHRVTELEALPGWAWNHFDALWEHGFDELRQYTAATGAPTPPARYVSPSGHALGQWTEDQRRNIVRGVMSADRRARLATLPGWIC